MTRADPFTLATSVASWGLGGASASSAFSNWRTSAGVSLSAMFSVRAAYATFDPSPLGPAA